MLKSVKKMHLFKRSLIMFLVLMCIHLHVSFVGKKKKKYHENKHKNISMLKLGVYVLR